KQDYGARLRSRFRGCRCVRGLRPSREPLPCAVMSSIVDALGISALRTRWRQWAVIAGGSLVVLYAVYKLVVIFVLTDENQPASEEIVAAAEVYKPSNKRYPEKIAQLQPKYLPQIPQPAPGTNFVDATNSDDTAARLGYRTRP